MAFSKRVITRSRRKIPERAAEQVTCSLPRQIAKCEHLLPLELGRVQVRAGLTQPGHGGGSGLAATRSRCPELARLVGQV